MGRDEAVIVRRLLHRLLDDRGVTVIELVIASALSLIVLLSVLAALDSGTRSERGSQARQETLVDLRGAMTRATKDIRQATSINPSSNLTNLDIQTLVLGTPKRMIFSVSGSSLRRTVCAGFAFTAACGGTAAPLASNVTTATAFCYDPPDCLATGPPAAPAQVSSVRITIVGTPEVRAAKEITLATDVQLRNI